MSIKSENKIDCEVTLIFKRFGYPFKLSKSSFYAIGSPTTWPSLLTAIVWLLPLLECIEKVERHKMSLIDNGNMSENEFFFQYYTKAYAHFLSGDDDVCARLDKKLALTFEMRHKELLRKLRKLENQKHSFMTNLDDYRNYPLVLNNLVGRKRMLMANNYKINISNRLEKKNLKTAVNQSSKRFDNIDKRERKTKSLTETIISTLEQSTIYRLKKRENLSLLRDKNHLQIVFLTKQKILLELHLTKFKKATSDIMNTLQRQWGLQKILIVEIEQLCKVQFDEKTDKKATVTFLKLSQMKESQLSNITYLNIKKAVMENVFFVGKERLNVLTTTKKFYYLRINQLENYFQYNGKIFKNEIFWIFDQVKRNQTIGECSNDKKECINILNDFGFIFEENKKNIQDMSCYLEYAYFRISSKVLKMLL